MPSDTGNPIRTASLSVLDLVPMIGLIPLTNTLHVPIAELCNRTIWVSTVPGRDTCQLKSWAFFAKVAIVSNIVEAAACHCKDCQKCTGSGKATIVIIPEEELSITGNLKFYRLRFDDAQINLEVTYILRKQPARWRPFAVCRLARARKFSIERWAEFITTAWTCIITRAGSNATARRSYHAQGRWSDQGFRLGLHVT